VVIHDIPGVVNLNRVDAYISSLQKVNGVIYMIDATTFKKNLADVAEDFLFVLETLKRRGGGSEMLVFANKNDLFDAVSGAEVKDLLEREISVIYRLRRKEDPVLARDVGREKEFTFEWVKNEGVSVEFVGGSVEQVNMVGVIKFLERVIKQEDRFERVISELSR
jgi:signal recognition particle receptor subunit beta